MSNASVDFSSPHRTTESTAAFLNKIATSVPGEDVHLRFVDYAQKMLPDEQRRALFRRMASRAQIEHRYSILEHSEDPALLDSNHFYQKGNFPSTKNRMRFYELRAFDFARSALDLLDIASIKDEITHLILTTCTGFYAPGIDIQIVEHYGLKPSVERTIIGFMGCYAAINALKLARHIVRSEPDAKVLILNLELCTLHFQETDHLEQVLSFLIFADGCAASLVSAEPVGLELKSFHSDILPESSEQITWHIGESGFDMVLSGQVAQTITQGLPSRLSAVLNGGAAQDIQHWAVHPGGRSILDAVQGAIGLPSDGLSTSRDVLRRFGNMSSATIMFVLKEMMEPEAIKGLGCALAFGPGVTVESMMFQTGSE